jgi:aryl-alcohol dehydrogenase-like predicted oxidoreductase
VRGINLPSSHDNVPGLFHSDRTSAFRWQTQMSSFVISPQSIRYCTVPLNQTHRIIMLDTTTSSVPADRHLGRTGPRVFPIALGCMGMSGMYGSTDDAESIRAIHAAIDGGITLIDTGDFYGMGHNELLLARALSELPSSTRDKVLLSVKFGAMRTPSGAWSGFDGRPAAVKNYLAYSLKRLGVAHIAIYRPARVDDQIPIEDTIGAVADMIKQGFVQYAALSEAGVETARRAQIVTPIVDVQLEYGITTRGMEAKVLPGLRDLGVGITAYGVLSRGLISGARPSEKSDFRRFLPRFTGAAGEANRQLIATLDTLAAQHGVTIPQLAITWALYRGDDIIPLLGSRTVAQVQSSLKALDLRLTPDDLSRFDQTFSADRIQGTRYDKVAMTHLDSER